MKISTQIAVALLGIVLLASSCATLNYSVGNTAEPINWREYNDC